MKHHLPKCEACGQFMRADPGASWQMVYSGYPPTPDHEIFRCVSCTEKHGPLVGQHGIRPEFAAGIFRTAVSASWSEPMNPCSICGYPIVPANIPYGYVGPVCTGHWQAPPVEVGRYQFTPTPLTADDVRRIVREEIERAAHQPPASP